jgi:hypothetical protein
LLDKFEDYFFVETKYRIKKSGSRDLNQKLSDDCLNALKSSGYRNIELIKSGKKYFVTTDNLLEDKTKIEGSSCTFYFVEESGKMRVKKSTFKHKKCECNIYD